MASANIRICICLDHAAVQQAYGVYKQLADDINESKREDECNKDTISLLNRMEGFPASLQCPTRLLLLSTFAVTNSMSLSSMTGGIIPSFLNVNSGSPSTEIFQ